MWTRILLALSFLYDTRPTITGIFLPRLFREMAGSPLVCDTNMHCVCFGQFFSNDTGVGCVPCPAGTYAAWPSTIDQPTTKCEPCPRETFSARAGQSRCQPQLNCGPGFAVAEPVQSTAPRHCIACQHNVSFTTEVTA